MANYNFWSEGLQELWDNTTGTEFIPDGWETDYYQNLFEIAFGHTGAEYDALGIDPETVSAAREEFFDYMGMNDDQFDWSAWRDEMGYE